MLSCPKASFIAFSNHFYIQKQSSSLAQLPGWKAGRKKKIKTLPPTLLLWVWGAHTKGDDVWEPTKRVHSIGQGEKQGAPFLNCIKKWTVEKDNIWKLRLSLAELAKSQEGSEDSSVVNNYHFVEKRGGVCQGPSHHLGPDHKAHMPPGESASHPNHPGGWHDWHCICLCCHGPEASCPLWSLFPLGAIWSCLSLSYWVGQVASPPSLSPKSLDTDKLLLWPL